MGGAGLSRPCWGTLEVTVGKHQSGIDRCARPSRERGSGQVYTYYLDRIGLREIRVETTGSQVDSRRAISVFKGP